MNNLSSVANPQMQHLTLNMQLYTFRCSVLQVFFTLMHCSLLHNNYMTYAEKKNYIKKQTQFGSFTKQVQ